MSEVNKVNVTVLRSYENNFKTEMTNFNNKTYSTFSSSYLRRCSDSAVSRMASSLQNSYEAIKRGYSNIDKWWTSYNDNISNLESYLSENASVGSISEASVRNSVAGLPKLSKYNVKFSGIIQTNFTNDTFRNTLATSTVVNKNNPFDSMFEDYSLSNNLSPNPAGTIKTLRGNPNAGISQENYKKALLEKENTIKHVAPEKEKLSDRIKYNVNAINDFAKNTVESLKKKWKEDPKECMKTVVAVSLKTMEKVEATRIVFGTSLLEGAGKVVEDIGDGLIIAETGLKTVGTVIVDTFESLVGLKEEGESFFSYTKETWEQTRAFTSKNIVSSLCDKFYNNTSIGQKLKEETFGFDTTRAVGDGIGYVGGTVALTIATCGVGGAAAGAGAGAGAASSAFTSTMAAVSGVAGLGRGSTESWNSGATTAEGLAVGVATGAWEALQAWAGGKIAKFSPIGKSALVKTTGQTIANAGIRVALDGADSALDSFEDPLVKALYKDGYYDEEGNYKEFTEDDNMWSRYKAIFKENGGAKSVGINIAIGSSMSLVGEAGDLRKYFFDTEATNVNTKNIVQDVNVKKADIDVDINTNGMAASTIDVNRVITEQDIQLKYDEYNKLIDIKNSDDYKLYMSEIEKEHAIVYNPKYTNLEKELKALSDEIDDMEIKFNSQNANPKVNINKAITEQELQTKLNRYDELLNIKNSDDYKLYISEMEKEHAIRYNPEYHNLEKELAILEGELAGYGSIKGITNSIDDIHTMEKIDLNAPKPLSAITVDLNATKPLSDITIDLNVIKNSNSVLETMDIAEEAINKKIKKLFNKKSSLSKAAKSVFLYPSILFAKFKNKMVLTNGNLSKNILTDGLYHFTDIDSANKIIESGYVKASSLLDSYGKKKRSYFFGGKPTFDQIAINLSDKLETKRVAVNIKINNLDELDGFNYRVNTDNAVSYIGNYEFKRENASLAYFGLAEENGNLVYKQLTKEQFDNYNFNISNSKISKWITNKKYTLASLASEYDAFIDGVKKNVKSLGDTKAKVANGFHSLLDNSSNNASLKMKKEILQSVSDINDPVLKAKKLYNELNKRINYDVSWAKASNKKDINLSISEIEYNTKKYYSPVNFKNLGNDNVICKGWSELYLELLKDSGYDKNSISILGDNRLGRHRYVEIKLNNGCSIIADATNQIKGATDLLNAKQGKQSNGFILVNSNSQVKSPKKIYDSGYDMTGIEQWSRDIDKTLGVDYTYDIIKQNELSFVNSDLAKQVFGENKLDLLRERLWNLDIPENMDGLEAWIYTRDFAKNVLGEESYNALNKNKNLFNELYVNNGDGINVITFNNNGSMNYIVIGKNIGKVITDSGEELDSILAGYVPFY